MCEFCKASSHCQGHWLVACLSAVACECVRQSQKTKKKKQQQRKKETMVGERSTDGHGFRVLPNWSGQALAHTLCSCLGARHLGEDAAKFHFTAELSLRMPTACCRGFPVPTLGLQWHTAACHWPQRLLPHTSCCWAGLGFE